MADPANLQPAILPTVTSIGDPDWIMVTPNGGDPSKITGANARPYLKGDPGVSAANLVGVKNSGSQNNSSNTTPTSITGLSAAVVSGRRYAVVAHIPFQTAATTTGIAFTWTGPAMSLAQWKARIPIAVAGVDHEWVGNATTLTAVLIGTAVAAANTTYLATVEGVFQPSANGTLQLQFRSEVNASQVTVLDGAVMAVSDCG